MTTFKSINLINIDTNECFNNLPYLPDEWGVLTPTFNDDLSSIAYPMIFIEYNRNYFLGNTLDFKLPGELCDEILEHYEENRPK